MASLLIFPLAFFGLIIGFYVFYKRLGLAGSAISIVIGIVSLYIALNISDIILSVFGYSYSDPFPPGGGGYYSSQALIFILLGGLMLSVYYFILREQKELSQGFLFSSVILLLTGAMDLVIDTLMRNNDPIARLFIALLVLGIILAIAYMKKGTLFRKESQPKQENAP